MVRLVDRLDEETRPLEEEAVADTFRLVAIGTADAYRSLLIRLYGFVAPLERSLLETPGLDRSHDPRRLRKRLLLEHDLEMLGLKDPRGLPQCLSVPLFDQVLEAMGWAYVVERSTLAHPELFRRLAQQIPGDVAFSSSYLKCYFGTVGEAWRTFGDELDKVAATPAEADRVVAAAKTAFRHLRRWRHAADGKALSGVGAPPAAETTG